MTPNREQRKENLYIFFFEEQNLKGETHRTVFIPFQLAQPPPY